MTDFRALKSFPSGTRLTDEQVDELIALQDGELIWFFGLTAEMSAAAAAKLRVAAQGFEIVQRKRN